MLILMLMCLLTRGAVLYDSRALVLADSDADVAATPGLVLGF